MWGGTNVVHQLWEGSEWGTARGDCVRGDHARHNEHHGTDRGYGCCWLSYKLTKEWYFELWSKIMSWLLWARRMLMLSLRSSKEQFSKPVAICIYTRHLVLGLALLHMFTLCEPPVGYVLFSFTQIQHFPMLPRLLLSRVQEAPRSPLVILLPSPNAGKTLETLIR